jgi:methylmalonyl-CoA mutase C-terminal domain/subunit
MAGMARPEEIAAAAQQEDVDLVGLNVGGSIAVVERILGLLREGRPDLPVLVGGTLSPASVRRLADLGVLAFPPGSTLASIAECAVNLTGGGGETPIQSGPGTGPRGADSDAPVRGGGA